MNEFVSEFTDSKLYGEFAESRDCPDDESFCKMIKKSGLITSTHQIGPGKLLHPTMPVDLPHHMHVQQGPWGAKAIFRNLEFIGFKRETKVGKEQLAIRMNREASDYTVMHEFYNIKFTDVENDALTLMYEPPQAWAIIKDCGEFPCTAPKNTIYSFVGTTFEGDVKPTYTGADFQIVPDIEGYTDAIPNCEKVEAWNAWHCNTEGIGILLFESQDPDKFDRSLQPIYLRMNGDPEVQNKLNSFMDHVWDGFY